MTNEYRVRKVERFVITHYKHDEFAGEVNQVGGDFPNLSSANAVCLAMSAQDVGSVAVQMQDVPEPLMSVHANTPKQAALLASFVFGEQASGDARKDIPILLRNAAKEVEESTFPGAAGVLVLRSRGQTKPSVTVLGEAQSLDVEFANALRSVTDPDSFGPQPT